MSMRTVRAARALVRASPHTLGARVKVTTPTIGRRTAVSAAYDQAAVTAQRSEGVRSAIRHLQRLREQSRSRKDDDDDDYREIESENRYADIIDYELLGKSEDEIEAIFQARKQSGKSFVMRSNVDQGEIVTALDYVLQHKGHLLTNAQQIRFSVALHQLRQGLAKTGPRAGRPTASTVRTSRVAIIVATICALITVLGTAWPGVDRFVLTPLKKLYNSSATSKPSISSSK